MVVLNFWHFQNIRQQYQITATDNPDALTIERGNPVTVAFTIEDPDKMGDLTVTIVYGQINQNTEIVPIINSKQYETMSQLSPGSSQTIALSTENLRRVNRIELRGQFSFASQASVQKITVTGVTGGQRTLFLILNILGIVTILGPVLVIKYLQYKRLGEMEEQFPNLLRDIVEGTRAGMSLPQSIQNATSNNYGNLTPYVKEMGAKLEWGVPFERVVQSFGKKTRSPIIMRAINTIIQTYRSGGNVSEVLEAVGNNLREIRELRAERESQIYSEMITGYVIYFVFLFVLIVLIRYFLPSLTFSGSIGAIGGGGLSAEQIVATYRTVFRWLIIVQSVFSGLVIGRLSEGELRAGGKHVAVLLGIGYTAALVFM